jgi:malate dehydrogenase (oxaloacetate-decarboxylating)(NADP+)
VPQNENKAAELRQAALEYHEFPVPGKLAIAATKQMVNQHDLALAYSPGVAAACEEIVADPANAFRYTARGNLVAVITNGTAVLGLGDIGPLAAKPVMEGKAVLFKKFADIDVFDIEVNEKNVDKLVEVIAALEPTFGGINLEDIKAPDCFVVERKLRERLKIPVFHDDQHGTAIVVGAALLNALKVVGKDISRVKLVASGAGAAAGHRPGWRGVEGSRRADGRRQGAVRAAHAAANAGRGDARCRRVPGPVGGRRAQA